MNKNRLDRSIKFLFIAVVLLVIVLLWIDEIFDLPHWLLNTKSTPVNLAEALLETFFVLFVALMLSFPLHRVLKHYRQLLDITEKEAARKQILLTEGYHRIKNDLFLLTNMIKLHIMEEEETSDLLFEILQRLEAIGALHEILIQNSDQTIDSAIFIGSLLEHFEKSLTISKSYTAHIDSFPLKSSVLTPMALMISELVTNAVKHAAYQKGENIFTLKVTAGEQIILSIENPTSENPTRRSSSSLGKQLIEALCDQLGSSPESEEDSDLFRFTVRFAPERLRADR